MDPYTELKYNFDGIKDILLQYSNKGIITNYVSKLKEALDTDDISAVKYFVKKISDWYEENLTAILTNDFVHQKGDHRKASRFLKEIEPKIQLIDSPNEVNNSSKNNSSGKTGPVIFISHKSEDSDFGNVIRQLLLNMRIKNNQIIFSSHPMNKIPFGEDIFEYLRQKISQDTYVIYLLSNKYFSSSACLNEMGASWVMQADNAKLFLPDFDHNNPAYNNSCVNKSLMGITLNGDLHCKKSLVSMMNEIVSLVNSDIEYEEVVSFVDSACEELKKLS